MFIFFNIFLTKHFLDFDKSASQPWSKSTSNSHLTLHPPCSPLNLPSRRYEALLVEGKLGASGIIPPNSRCLQGALLGGIPPRTSSPPLTSGRGLLLYPAKNRCQHTLLWSTSTSTVTRSLQGTTDCPNFPPPVFSPPVFFVTWGILV